MSEAERRLDRLARERNWRLRWREEMSRAAHLPVTILDISQRGHVVAQPWLMRIKGVSEEQARQKIAERLLAGVT